MVVRGCHGMFPFVLSLGSALSSRREEASGGANGEETEVCPTQKFFRSADLKGD